MDDVESPITLKSSVKKLKIYRNYSIEISALCLYDSIYSMGIMNSARTIGLLTGSCLFGITALYLNKRLTLQNKKLANPNKIYCR